MLAERLAHDVANTSKYPRIPAHQCKLNMHTLARSPISEHRPFSSRIGTWLVLLSKRSGVDAAHDTRSHLGRPRSILTTLYRQLSDLSSLHSEYEVNRQTIAFGSLVCPVAAPDGKVSVLLESSRLLTFISIP